MSIIYFLLPLAIVLVLFFIGLFIWATLTGQYDDLETPSQRILLEDTIKPNYSNHEEKHD